MSSIEFQNGFLCGMATKGLTKSGQTVSADVWNDEGTYTYFYLDMRLPLQSFSTGMFTESIYVIGTAGRIEITGISKISSTIYKVYCNFAGQTSITILGRADGVLVYTTGEKLPSFSLIMLVSGVISYHRVAYAYDSINLDQYLNNATESFSFFADRHYEAGSLFDGTKLDEIGEAYESFYIKFT